MNWSRSSSSNNNYSHIRQSSPFQFGRKSEQIGICKGKDTGPEQIANGKGKGNRMASNPFSIITIKSGSGAAAESVQKLISNVKSEVVSSGKKDWEPEDDGIDTNMGCVLRSPDRRLAVFERICPEE